MLRKVEALMMILLYAFFATLSPSSSCELTLLLGISLADT